MESYSTQKRCFLCRTAVELSSSDVNKNVCSFCPKSSATIYYCSPEHLSLHRGNSHKNRTYTEIICWPFCIETKPLIGRIMVATRDIRAGETILEEQPAVWGPNSISTAVCLECLNPPKILHLECNDKQDESTIHSINKCSKCRFPVCGREGK